MSEINGGSVSCSFNLNSFLSFQKKEEGEENYVREWFQGIHRVEGFIKEMRLDEWCNMGSVF